MNKIILIPDSFKGTMSSNQACEQMRAAVLAVLPNAEVISIPIADGGEGSVDALLAALGGEKRIIRVQGPNFREIDTFYGLLDEGRTAVIETAACAGLPLAGAFSNPSLTTTYGVGQIISHAVQNGCRRVILGLGGSATNDGGAGMAAALGARFINSGGEAFVPVGGTLREISRIDISVLTRRIDVIEFIALCDVDNPLLGENGAARVFSPQKGASPGMVEELELNLAHLSQRIRRDLGVSTASTPCSGAAGGMGAGAAAFLKATLRMGIETMLDAVGFESIIKGADLVLSGEGRFDAQSLRGKAVIGAAKRAKAAGVPLFAVVGDIGSEIDAAYDMGVTGVFSINRTAIPFREAKKRAKSDLRLTVENLMRVYKALKQDL